MNIVARHVGIVVKDIEGMKDFYSKFFELEPMSDNMESGAFIESILGISGVTARIVKLKAQDGAIVELLDFGSFIDGDGTIRGITSKGISHMAFTVSDIDEITGALKKEEVRFISEPKIASDSKAKVAFCQDPEGNFIELVEELNA